MLPSPTGSGSEVHLTSFPQLHLEPGCPKNSPLLVISSQSCQESCSDKSVCVCVRACVRACMRVCVCVRVRVCVRVCTSEIINLYCCVPGCEKTSTGVCETMNVT